MKVLGRKLFLLKGERGETKRKRRRSLFEEDLFLPTPATSMGTLPHCSFSNCRACEARSLVRRVKQISSF